MRMPALSLIEKSERALMIVPIYDKKTSEYTKVCSYFDKLVNIGKEKAMVMRPTNSLIKIDGLEDYFTMSKNVRGCWLLTKNMPAETAAFSRKAKELTWSHDSQSTSRFAFFEKGAGQFGVSDLTPTTCTGPARVAEKGKNTGRSA